MKPHRSKHNRKIFTFYRINCGFHPPYRVLVDAAFVKAAAATPITFMEHIRRMLDGRVVFHVTPCARADFTDKLNWALDSCQRFECNHKDLRSSRECYSHLVSGENPQKFIVASGQTRLIRILKGSKKDVPLIVMRGPIPAMEEPNPKSIEKHVQVHSGRVRGNDTTSSTVQVASTKKKKGGSTPNPLSCMKPKVDLMAKNREKRLRRRQRLEASLQVVVSS